MQPVFRSSTTSFITPTSSPCDDFTFVPTILLAWTYVVLLVVVLSVWANIEATAKPKKLIVAGSMIDVFISDKSFRLNLMRADKQESLRAAVADVKTTGAMTKMIFF
jgi:hypothetical protein